MGFGEYVRARREVLGQSLREFCELNGFDPGNTSRMERGVVPPPESEELVVRYGEALGLGVGSGEMVQLLDMAAAERGKLPSDISQHPELLKTLPAFFKTLRGRKDSFEEEVKDRFQAHVAQERGTPYVTTDVDVLVDPATGRDFDFELTPLNNGLPKMALEIFRMVESEDEVEARSFHGRIWEKLKEELDSRGVRDYLIRTPARFEMPKAKVMDYCQRIADAIQDRVKRENRPERFEVESFSATKIEGLGPVVFSSLTGGRFVSPEWSAGDALERKLLAKDRQLPHSGYERVILAVNWIVFMDVHAVISALASMDLSLLHNTDRIYFETAPGRVALVYDRHVRAMIDSGEGPPAADAEVLDLYHAWLGSRIGRKDRRAFQLVREVSARVGHMTWIRDRHVREGVIWLAADLTESGACEDGLWAARQFRNDPDPPVENYPDDPEGKFNLHERVKRGERILAISSVRASTCWLLQKLAVQNRPELFSQILEMVEALARDENLYIRQQATVPLIELANRRWLKGADGDFVMGGELRARIRALGFEMLWQNRESPGVLEWVARIFQYLHDINENEAEMLLTSLLGNCSTEARDIVGHLLIYFAAYREHHFPELGRFDAARFGARLVDTIHHGPDHLRATIAWQMAGILKELPEDFGKLRPFITEIPEGPYDNTTFFHFFRICNILPANLRAQLQTVTEKALEKDRHLDPLVSAFEGAKLVSSEDFARGV